MKVSAGVSPLAVPSAQTTRAPDWSTARSMAAGDVHVTGEPIALGDEEQACPRGAELAEGSGELGAIVELAGAGELVGVDAGDLDAMARGPRVDGGELRLGPEVLLGGGDPQVGNGDGFISACSAAFRHARLCSA